METSWIAMGKNHRLSPVPIAVEIANQMANVLGVPVKAVPPLSNRVDTDALEALVSMQECGGEDVTIRFEFQEHTVLVDGNRAIDIT